MSDFPRCPKCNNNFNTVFNNGKFYCTACICWFDNAKIPDFVESLDKMRELHLRKNDDYADSDNPFSNFEFTEFVLSYFKSDRDKAFVWPIATKLARLATLFSSNKSPNNESVDDSFLDMAVYTLLWKADVKRR